jgi:hypothetical protein
VAVVVVEEEEEADGKESDGRMDGGVRVRVVVPVVVPLVLRSVGSDSNSHPVTAQRMGDK